MKRILIISSNRLGDSILSSGIINFLKKNNPNARLTYVCGPIPGSLFRFSMEIDNLIITKKKSFSFHWIKVWFQTFYNFWDLVIDLRGTGLSFFVLTKKRVIFRSKEQNIHAVEQISKIIGNEKLPPKINIEKKLLTKISYLNLLIKKKRSNKLIIIAPTANWIGKVWPIERYSKLIMKLKNNKYLINPLFIIVAPIEESKFAKKLLKLKNVKILNLIGKTNLGEIFLIMKECSLFIGNDSGLMHLAAASGIPTVGLFGPSNSKKYRPWGKKSSVILSKKTP
jgi:ADP-heptose:LPS heptosyltransferase